MLKLMKYEFLKKSKMLFIAFAGLIFLELAILFCIWKGGNWTPLAIMLVFLITVGTILYVFIDSIRSYSTELNQKEGYSLFLTPTSGYKIIGSKAIVSFIQLIVFALLVFVFMILNYQFVNYIYHDTLMSMINPIIDEFKKQSMVPTLSQFSLFALIYIFEWFTVIMIATLAITLRKTILSNSKLGWLISLVFFIIIYSIMEAITMIVLAPFGFYNEMFHMASVQDPSTVTFDIFKYVGIAACLYPVYIGITFYFSGRLLNNRVDL